ncbi:MAG: UvrD-helicase domain-containing protein [Vulcanibacillus sp.]
MSIYSVLIYYRKCNKNAFNMIMDYVRQGVKVYFLTESLKDELENALELEEIKTLTKLISSSILSINYDVGISLQHNNLIIVEDGNISNELKEELKLDGNFNIEQYEIEHEKFDTNLVIKAGAGTGKTKTMIDRVLYLVLKGIAKFEDIVMITFTNKAANQMRDKLLSRLESYYQIVDNKYKSKYLDLIDELAKMRIQTIHSFSKDIIEAFGIKLGISKDYKIRNLNYEKRKLLEDLINDYRFENGDLYDKYKYFPQYKLIDAIMEINNHLLNRGVDLNNNELILNWGVDEYHFYDFLGYLLNGLFQKIDEYKKTNSIIELYDLVNMLYKFINSNSDFTGLNINYLMIDEFQDTDVIQIEFVLWIMKQFNSIVFAVGDTKQGIYRFRGALETAFQQFKKELDDKLPGHNLKEYYLNKNYRSSQTIINELNYFFDRIVNINFDRNENKYFNFIKSDWLESTKKESKYPCIKFFSVENDQDNSINYICELVKKNNKRNYNLKENEKLEQIAVLVRTNKELEEVVEKLEKRNIVCNTEVSGSFYRSIAVREFYILIRALLFPKVMVDQYAFIQSSYGTGIDNNQILNNAKPTDQRYLNKILENNESYEKLNEYRQRIDNEPFHKIIKDIIDGYKPYINYGVKLAAERKNEEDIKIVIDKIKTKVINYKMNLSHLFYILDSRFSNIEMNVFDLEKFLRLMIQTNSSEDEKKIDAINNNYDITCMTVHKAKGLEFDHIVLPRTRHQFFNNKMDLHVFLNIKSISDVKVGYKFNMDELYISNDNYGENIYEEEREIIAEEIRLLYVALTRAKKYIHINKNEILSNTGTVKNWMELIERGGLGSGSI